MRPDHHPSADYLTARETTQLLDVKLQTLYAYVSRGLIRSTGRAGRKDRMYLREDVERVHARALARSGHGPVAADAMNHGHAIIPTAITEITPQGPRYRGRLATDLARQAASFEAVSKLLWTGEWDADVPSWTLRPAPPEFVGVVNTFGDPRRRNPLLEVFALAILHLGIQRRARARRLVEESIYGEGRHIIGYLVGCCGLASAAQCYVPMRRGERIADGLLRAFGGQPTPENSAAASALLALLADHELSPGTLSVRVAASGGATLHGCIASALCASSGLNVAHVFDDVDEFLAAGSGKAGWLKEAVQRHQQGRPIPGFGHPLYPKGDPRAAMLLDLIRARRPTRQLLALCEFVEEVQRLTGLHVRHEVPMVALTRAMGLPKAAASAMFLVSRTAGWVAHIQEQRDSRQLMRPRALFTGARAPLAESALKNQS
jgi:citrate synthase